MTKQKFDEFVLAHGRDILWFCRMTAGNAHEGDELYQDMEDGIAAELARNGKQQNVSMFAFTATPKPTTLQLFGTLNTNGQREAFHVYSMKQAIEEGFILDVLQNYITYKTFYKIRRCRQRVQNDRLLASLSCTKRILPNVSKSSLSISAILL